MSTDYTKYENFSRLNELTESCRRAQVGWHLQFEECEGRWYLHIQSAAPTECTTFKKYGSAGEAIADAIGWIDLGFKYDARGWHVCGNSP